MLKEKKSLFRQLLMVALPIMASNLLQQLYNLIDTYYLGSLGAEALSAPSITNNISNFLIVFGAGFSLAGTTLIGQSFGHDKNDRETLDKLTSQVFTINIIMSTIVVILGVSLTEPLCKLLSVPAGLTYEYTISYMRITFMCMPFLFMDMILRSTLQGTGDSVTPLLVLGIGVIVNIILDPIFIFVLDLEVAGAAWATLISRVVSSSIGLSILISGKKGLKLRRKYLIPDKPIFKLVFKIGFPSAIGQAISNLGFAVIQGFVNAFGPNVIAGFGVGSRITGLFQMPAMGISQSVTVLTARKLGENRPDEASKIVKQALIFTGIFTGIGMAFCFFRGDIVMRIFTQDPAVIAVGIEFFHTITFSIVVFALYTVLTGAFQGGGVTKPIMVFNIFRLWGVRVPLSAFLPGILIGYGISGTYGIWYSMVTSNVLSFIFVVILFSRGTWKKHIDVPQE